MKRLKYGNPGSPADRARYMARMAALPKEVLLVLLKRVAESCDMEGKGFVNQWEDTIRSDIGYTHGKGL